MPNLRLISELVRPSRRWATPSRIESARSTAVEGLWSWIDMCGSPPRLLPFVPGAGGARAVQCLPIQSIEYLFNIVNSLLRPVRGECYSQYGRTWLLNICSAY